MLKDLSINESIKINANAAKVWQVMTDPELIKIYLFGTETITDWQPGSEIIFQGTYQDQTYKDRGKVLEYIYPNKIVYSYWSGFSGVEDLPENYVQITYKIESEGETILFSWIQNSFWSEAAYEHSKTGIPGLLSKIKQLAESL